MFMIGACSVVLLVLEAILVGSARNGDELDAREEFELYRGVVEELSRRLDEMQACYE